MKKYNETSIFVKAAAFALVVSFSIIIVQLQLKYNSLKDQKNYIESEINDLIDEKDELENKVNSEINEDYIIETAKEKLNLRMPEEIIFYNDLFNADEK